MPYITDVMDLLLDFTLMVEEEIVYMKTGKHPGLPMRDCLGQWESLAREASRIIEAVEDDEPFV